MLLFYNGFIRLYGAAMRLAALGNRKAAAWIEGRKEVFAFLERSIAPTDHVIWVHCASAGEFEQGKPVMEALKRQYPRKKILVSFFSPSGYAMAKNYAAADVVTYLPLDTPKNAARFFSIVHPELVLFVKYEFWYHHLAVAAFHHVPILLISAVFRPGQAFFKPYGQFYRQLLFLFRHIFVQDEPSLQMLRQHGIRHASLSGDTRFDRVTAIAAAFTDLPLIAAFTGDKKTIVAGSTWPGDEEVLAAYLQQNGEVKLIIAPHEINRRHIEQVSSRLPGTVLLSEAGKNKLRATELFAFQTLVIDSVGLLSRLYHYATIAYVGGGFTRDGIHNILEAAVWGKPVIFGPNYEKYREAGELIAAGGGASFDAAPAFKKIADDLLTSEDHLQQTGSRAKDYITQNTGATGRILQVIQEKRLLTN